jgi:hypothetical protein
MRSFRAFVHTQSRRSLDSFLGLTSAPCLQSPNSFGCHTSENSSVSPTIATDPKTHVSKSCTCHIRNPPGAFPFPLSPVAPFPLQRMHNPVSVSVSVIDFQPSASSIYPLSFQTIANSFAPRKNVSLLFSSDSELFSQNIRGWVFNLSGGEPLSTTSARLLFPLRRYPP